MKALPGILTATTSAISIVGILAVSAMAIKSYNESPIDEVWNICMRHSVHASVGRIMTSPGFEQCVPIFAQEQADRAQKKAERDEADSTRLRRLLGGR